MPWWLMATPTLGILESRVQGRKRVKLVVVVPINQVVEVGVME